MQQEVDRTLETWGGDRVGHPPTLSNRPIPLRAPLATCQSTLRGALPWRPMDRVLSGIAPSGNFTLGNYLGALRQWVSFQDGYDAFYFVVDLHALTTRDRPGRPAGQHARRRPEPARRRAGSRALHPLRAEPRSRAHQADLAARDAPTTMGELRRMTQFKDKGKGQETARVALFTYPVLMAADILLYDAAAVPVGDDQRQHLELTRDVAIRFNHRYGETFVVPEAAIPSTGARVMDLQHPERKMSKSADSPLGTIRLLDSDEEITRRCARRSPTPTARCATTGRPSRAWPTSSTCWPRRPDGRPSRWRPATSATGTSRTTWRRRCPNCSGRFGSGGPNWTRTCPTSTRCWRAVRRTPTRWRPPPTPGPPTPSGSCRRGRLTITRWIPSTLAHQLNSWSKSQVIGTVGVQEEVQQDQPQQDRHRVLPVAQIGRPVARRQQPLEEHRAVEGRDRDQVEDAEPHVDQADVEDDLRAGRDDADRPAARAGSP